MEETIQTVNFVRFGILNHRLFKILPEKMDSDHTVLIFLAKVRWLSKGQVFARVNELWADLEIFFRQIKSSRSKHFGNKKFIGAFAYRSDIFSHLNILNLQMQRTSITVFDARDKVQSFRAKLDM